MDFRDRLYRILVDEVYANADLMVGFTLIGFRVYPFVVHLQFKLSAGHIEGYAGSPLD